MADDVVHHTVQAGPRHLVFLLTGQLLLPPETVVYTEQRTALFELPKLFLEVGIVRLQDAILDIMGGSTAHGKKLPATELIDLAPHEMQDGGTYPLDLSAMPLLFGITFVGVIIFVVPEHKGGGVWPILQPVQSCIVLWVTMPYPAKISVITN